MNEPSAKQITGELSSVPWLAITDLLPWTGGTLGRPTHKIHDVRSAGHVETADKGIEERQRSATAVQLATSIRMQGIDSEASAMLGLLENLLQAGEIPHNEYFRRVENLFPHQMAVIDHSLKQKISALSA